ncbi:TetR/AcrR family transcriptional regulator [Anaerosacchariphilus polymeriproducens]|nr:TetR/AcrR family transcriptional regulator [Anaerosacchariphilus polymeriproducens]
MGDKGRKTKELIIKKSYQIFSEKGFSAVTMQDICKICELSRGGLYRYYSSTQQIFEEILIRLTESDEDIIKEGIRQKCLARDILNAALEKMQKEMLDSNTSLSYAIYEYSVYCKTDFIMEINQKAKDKWVSLINYGIQQKEFPKINPEQIADLLLYVYQGVRIFSRIIPIKERTINNIILQIKQDLGVNENGCN